MIEDAPAPSAIARAAPAGDRQRPYLEVDMPAPLKVVPHLSNAEIEARYRAAPDATLSRHWQVVLLVARGEGVATAAKVTTLSIPWVRRIVQRYNQDGPAGLGDHRHNNPGATSPLTAEVITELREALAGDAPDGGVWSGPKAAVWLSARLGQPVDPKKAWRWLRELGYVLRRPRPRHPKGDKEDQTGSLQEPTRRQGKGGPGRASRRQGDPLEHG